MIQRKLETQNEFHGHIIINYGNLRNKYTYLVVENFLQKQKIQLQQQEALLYPSSLLQLILHLLLRMCGLRMINYYEICL